MKKVKTTFCHYDINHELTEEEKWAFFILNKRHCVTLEILEKNERVWSDYDGIHSSNVDPEKFGGHKYDDDHDHTSDCAYGCGCWMGPCRSGGKVDPFGPCPNNPKNGNEQDN